MRKGELYRGERGTEICHSKFSKKSLENRGTGSGPADEKDRRRGEPRKGWTEREDEDTGILGLITILPCRLSLRMLIGSWNITTQPARPRRSYSIPFWRTTLNKVQCRTNQGEDSYINSFWILVDLNFTHHQSHCLGLVFFRQRESAMHALLTPLAGTMKTYKFSSFPQPLSSIHVSFPRVRSSRTHGFF